MSERLAAAGAARDDAVRVLHTPATIRERCHRILHAVEAGRPAHFRVDRAALDPVAERIAAMTARRFPDGRIPYHSRWRHFEAGGLDRKAELDAALAGADALDLARAHVDLALVSVLLDAGAGAGWRYAETGRGQTRAYTRSEGLGVASFRAFMAGLFSSDPARPCRVDAVALQGLQASALCAAFHVREDNPLVGVEGRVELLHRLGAAMAAQPAVYGPLGRPGGLVDHLAATSPVRAGAVLQALLGTLSGIWPSGQRLGGVPVGDAWRHPEAGGDGDSAGWVPFHKLSQWLTYSLLEPLQWAGFDVGGLDELTGLPEYRNGGLLLDAGVLLPVDPLVMARPLTPADPWVVEWRALTVALLDVLAPRVRARLGLDEARMPLACVLEGGSWAAGREIAAERRPGGAPPVQIDSDGTVF